MVIFGCFAPINKANIRVQIENGAISGIQLQNFKGGTFYAFQSIPYAQPPIGNLRFQKPQIAERWDGTLDCSQPAPFCVQLQPVASVSIFGQEDCLYLNVYTPNIHPQADLFPVFVFIHGGGWLIGGSDPDQLGPNYLMTESIVLVIINYRLGVFGNTVRNVGLFDQIEALKWVQTNIRQFNGDPKRVTLGGQSAGGMAAHLHLLSPRSHGLFHQIIAMSGTSLNPLTYVKRNYTTGLIAELRLQDESTERTLNRMQQMSVEDIMNAYVKVYGNLPPSIDSWSNGGVFIDNSDDPDAFITEYPIHILQSGKYPKLPMMIGFTNNEAEWIRLFQNFQDMLDLNRHLPFYFTEKREEILRQVQKFYGIDEEDVQNKSVFNVRLWTDIWFKVHSYRTALLHNSNEIFFYQFSANANLHFIPIYENFQYSGAAHTDDIAYLFSNNVSITPKIGSLEENVVTLMVNAFAHFIRYGTPSVDWKRFSKETPYYGDISHNGMQLKQFSRYHFDFWERIYQMYAPNNF